MRTALIRFVNGVGGLEPLLDLVGLSIRKKIRIQVAILRDPSTPLGMTATPSSAEGPLDETQNILWNEAHITLARASDRIRVLEDIAPEAALRVRLDSEAAAEYFGSHARSGPTVAFGYGDPVTVFVVREVVGHDDCSIDRGANYVILERSKLERGNRVMAHKVAHACGLHHVSDDTNLMSERRHGRALKPWQRAVFRNSPHVTHF